MKLAIVGIFYDGYKSVWTDFLRLFKRFWPNCPYPLYVVGQTESLKDFSDIGFLSAGPNAEFSDKIRKAVEEIDADYFLVLLEDFFFSESIDEDPLEPLLKYVFENEIDYCALPLNEFSSSKTFNGRIIENSLKVRSIPASSKYTLSCQPSIWRKGFLKDRIGKESYNAWVFEGIYALSSEAHTPDFLRKCIANKDNVLRLKHGIVQGSFLPNTHRFFKKKYDYTFNCKMPVMRGLKLFRYKTKIAVSRWLPKPALRLFKSFNRGGVLNKNKEDISRVMLSFGYHNMEGGD